ncbi:RusA family crossover junction endodeoxyribonuclease [Deinococcus sp. HMF7620]|uniref:RusA family crossover junction endodeoxyribonuclease n=1 Tax=Deinococcus arboris TaxID=2682977 RepID=A0A7C9I2X2_9DEIO|nr:RusA family crossover junction endodeoxyribonuclease [Deinococcus arboris]MVN86891.1 RusA family crossover junction endodeoxyribonuclease [Deinococcus arboris]
MTPTELHEYMQRFPHLFPQRRPVPAAGGAGVSGVPGPLSAPSPAALQLTLPYPPSVNRIWRAVVVRVAGEARARVLLSQAGRRYRAKVLAIVADLGGPSLPAGARLAVHLHACPPDRRKRDLSNIPKALEDALTHAQVWADDSLIDDLRVTRGPVLRGGCVLVTITPLEASHL